MYAGKHCNNWFVRICSAPGMWMQRLTTREPSDEQLEIALTAIRYALPEFFPDMDRESYLAEEGVSTHDTQ
jgi:uncharacterized protein YqhQ